MPRTNSSQRVERLRLIPLFASLSVRQLQRVARTMSEFDVPAGHVLVEPKTAGSGLFVIDEGTVTVAAGKKRIELGPGEFFGELALLTDRLRTARVQARTPVKCLAISRFDFEKMLESEPKVALAMLRILAARLADTASPVGSSSADS